MRINYWIVIIAAIFLPAGCRTNKTQQQPTFNYSIDQPVEGQIHTVEKFRAYMQEKNYEPAIQLFSKRQQASIRELQKNKDNFRFWCKVWTLDQATFDEYIANIKAGKGIFIFEDGVWKIDEK